MLKRKMYQKLKEWRRTKERECLLIKGARQIGKTTIVREFGKHEYKSFIEINFLKNPDLKSIFQGSLEPEEIYKRITAVMNKVNLIPGNTLIFLDEIQKCASARTALKFLAEDDRYDVISSGSLLGLHYGDDADPEVEKVESVPVGYEQQITMYSMDFEEYLWANEYTEEAIGIVRAYYEKKEKVPELINEKYKTMFREYSVVGGMPEVVASFCEYRDFGRVQQIQEKILAAYDDDIAYHAKGEQKTKVRNCYRTIPSQLARENKKFKYSEVEKKSTGRKYKDSIEWLRDSNLVHVCHNVYEPVLPLRANEKENEFKLYLNDTGLLMALYGKETKLSMLQNTIKGNAKGGIFENLISEMLVKNGYRLYYYKRPDSTQEIEFLTERNGSVVPLEVKAGNNASESMNRFIAEYHPEEAIKLVDGNVGEIGTKTTLPHYMAMFL